MKRNEMKIVGLNMDDIFVQRKIRGCWKQDRMSFKDFFQMMQTEFPEYYNQCDFERDYERANYFYNYGENGAETFIFR